MLVPGYTHMQAAMPSSFGLWFGAFAENLIDDLRQWLATFEIINQNPLGSAAGYGSSLPIKRNLTTQFLGFSDLNYNVVHAQMTRGRSELFMAFGCATTGNSLAKLAMDICLYTSQNFQFIELPDAFTTGSSIMPHKKNPDVFELIRAHGNDLTQLPGQITGIAGFLPSGYHRDFQILKEKIFPALQKLASCIEVMTLGLENIKVNHDIIKDPKYRFIFSVERVNQLVLEGVPFREAYQIVGQEIEKKQFHPRTTLLHSHEGSIGQLNTKEIHHKLKKVMSRFDFTYMEKLKILGGK